MPFITLGSSSQLQLQYPTQGSTSWSSVLQTETFLKISTHDHTGSGNGSVLGTGSIAADAITGAKIRLDNDEYLRGRNAADSANINIIKVNASDLLELGATVNNFNIKNNTYITGRNQADSANIDIVKIDGGDQLDFGTQVSVLNMKQDTYFTGRNAANSANINMIKVNSSDELALGATLANADLKANTYLTSNSVNLIKTDSNSRVDLADGQLVLKGTDTIADAASAATLTNCPTAGTNEALFIYYKMVRNGAVQFGQLIVDEDNSGLIEECYGDDVGVTFTENAGAIQATATSTGNPITMTYTIIKL